MRCSPPNAVLGEEKPPQSKRAISPGPSRRLPFRPWKCRGSLVALIPLVLVKGNRINRPSKPTGDPPPKKGLSENDPE